MMPSNAKPKGRKPPTEAELQQFKKKFQAENGHPPAEHDLN